MRRYKSVALAPFLTALLLCAVFFLYQLYPFAENTLSWCDMNQQVIPILLNFKDILSGSGDLFLNMSNAGGMNFWGVFLFFISSPFSFLVAFVDKQDMSLFMNILVLLKMMVCAATASYFFQTRFSKLPIAAVTALGAMYAFCGYTMMYYQNVVWLDMMYLFPLLLVGMDRLLRLKKPLMYILVLCAVLAVNFYLSYMVVLFLLLAMSVFLLWRCGRDERAPTAALFLSSSFIAALITAPVWLPALMQYLASARGTDFLSNLASGNFFTSLPTTLPVILCTAAIFSALPFFTLTKKQNRRSTWGWLMLFVLMLIPVFIEPINKMWHTGSYQAFPVRYGYITVFIGLILVALVLSQKPENGLEPRRTRPIVLFPLFAGILALFGLAGWLVSFHLEELSTYTRTLWGNNVSLNWFLLFFAGAFLVYFAVIYLYRFRHISRSIFSIALIVVLVCECLFSASIYIGSSVHNVNTYRSLVSLSGELPQDGNFYRVKNYKKRSDVNMTGALGYPSLAHYTSLTSQEYLFGMKKLGYSGYWMEINSCGGTLLTDALLSNRYTLKYRGDLNEYDQPLVFNNLFTFIENDYFLPLGLRITEDPAAIAELPDGSRIETQEYLYQTLLNGQGQLFTQYTPFEESNLHITAGDKVQLSKTGSPATVHYTIQITDKQTLYFDCFQSLSTRLKEPEYASFSISVNGQILDKSYPNQRSNGLMELGTFENETVSIELTLLKNVSVKSFGVYGLHHNLLEEAVANAPAVEVSVQNRTLSASCEGSQGEYLYVSVPYDSGFEAYVNGQKTEIFRVNDTFMAIPLQEGTNQITLTFLPSGLKAGLLLAGIGVLALIFFLWRLRRGCKPFKFLHKTLYVIFLGCAGLVFLAIYLFPVLVYVVF